MEKAGILYWVVAVLALIWGLIGLSDYYFTVTENQAYLKDFPQDMVAWILGFPKWRIGLWAIGVSATPLAAIFLLLRKAWAVPLFALSLVAMVIGIFYDLFFANGFEMYGTGGLIFSLVLFLVSLFFWWWSKRAKDKGLFS